MKHDRVGPAGSPVTTSGRRQAATPSLWSGLSARQPAALLALQRAAGNRAVRNMLLRACDPFTRGPASCANADAIVSPNTSSWGRIDRPGVAAELLSVLPGSTQLVEETFDRLPWNARDDVAQELVAALRKLPDPAERVSEIAAAGGRRALLRVVRELQEGYTFDSEADDMRSMLGWLEGSTPTVERWGRDTIEVEVITFEHGAAALDWAGERIFGKGARGHTAIVVGGLAYSFDEGGWEVGQTKNEYLNRSENLVRDGVGQVLDLSMSDARLIQGALDRAANRGVYLLGGDVCSDATARALSGVIGGFRRDSNPQHLRAQLDAIPLLVHEERQYHNGAVVPATPPQPSGRPVPEPGPEVGARGSVRL